MCQVLRRYFCVELRDFLNQVNRAKLQRRQVMCAVQSLTVKPLNYQSIFTDRIYLAYSICNPSVCRHLVKRRLKLLLHTLYLSDDVLWTKIHKIYLIFVPFCGTYGEKVKIPISTPCFSIFFVCFILSNLSRVGNNQLRLLKPMATCVEFR